jgi:hypothetical protein
MKVRRVVTGHNAKGRSVFVQDEKVDSCCLLVSGVEGRAPESNSRVARGLMTVLP